VDDESAVGISGFEQLKKYASDLAVLHREKKESQKELDRVYRELERYASDLALLYKTEKRHRSAADEAHREVQKLYMPLRRLPSGDRAETAVEENDHVELFGYYKGATSLSGDYFNFKRLDDRHHAVIICDVSGKGIAASLIMVQIATIFDTYFRKWTVADPGHRVDQMVYLMNDLLVERDFRGRFAALTVGIIDGISGTCYLCHAGDNQFLFLDGQTRRLKTVSLPAAPVIGVFPSELVALKTGYRTNTLKLRKNDRLYFSTDGLDESRRNCEDSAADDQNPGEPATPDFEYFGKQRIKAMLGSVMTKSNYDLDIRSAPFGSGTAAFNFSECGGSLEETVTSLFAAERIFRFRKGGSSFAAGAVSIDDSVVSFLRKYLTKFDMYFDDNGRTLPGIHEDDQYDDIAILALRKK